MKQNKEMDVKNMSSKVFISLCVLLLLSSLLGGQAVADVAMKDDGIVVSKIELINAAKYWPQILREGAIKNEGARYELLNQFMLNRKIAERMKSVTEESDPEFYWQREFAIRNLQNKLYLHSFKEKLKVPDMMELAKQRYLVSKHKYAEPEKRKASHILLKCLPGVCDRKEKRPIAEKILKELKAGANFEEMVEKYSEDPGSKARKGSLKGWIRLSEPKMDPVFVGGLFSIKNIENYSDIVETQFGFHIIRLDDIKAVTYQAEEDVIKGIVANLEIKYRYLSELAFISSLTLSDKAFIDDEIVSEILESYKPEVQEQDGEGKERKLIIKKFTRP